MNPPPLPPPLPDRKPPPRLRSRIALGGLAVSAVTYLVSLSLPALLFAEHAPVSGATVLASGWMGIFAGGQLGWYANPLYATAIILTLTRRYRGALWFGLAALPVALHSRAATAYYFNEANSTGIEGLGSAFSVWFAALAILPVASALALLSLRPRRA